MSGPDRLAVYGTLVPGADNGHVLAGVPGEWRPGHLRGHRFEDGWRGYPGVVLDPAGDPVAVLVLTSPSLPDHWDRLDSFEGPGYRRVVADVTLADGVVVPAQVYVLAASPGAR